MKKKLTYFSFKHKKNNDDDQVPEHSNLCGSKEIWEKSFFDSRGNKCAQLVIDVASESSDFVANYINLLTLFIDENLRYGYFNDPFIPHYLVVSVVLQFYFYNIFVF